ncbi:hypothetical protein FisN_15Hh284 [Fistulifera solaris]|uniref:VASt domain-containing protein n=1 Tax=Fistulifera solaris TaxID=1519565 RepID=A0A1Z5JFL8_FISSO|nr:hypothetical protein FisN_15Hh284 [Fistulifera solaris]|eukprot:GAX12805.1 hypothetical protein FisN_15Hh284 [Fistulifera solaris]
MRIEGQKTPCADGKEAPYLDVETTTTSSLDESDDPHGSEKVQIQFEMPEIYLYENICSAADDDEEIHRHFSACSPKTPSRLSEWFLAKATFQQDQRAKTDEESVGSVNSVTYFEPADFNRSNWESVMNAPTMGLAFVGIAMALTHPLLFVAGLITAVGTATAASRGYECIDKDMYSQIWESLFHSSGAVAHDALESSTTATVDEAQQKQNPERPEVDTSAEMVKSAIESDRTPAGEQQTLKTSPRKRKNHKLPPCGPSIPITSKESKPPVDWITENFTDLKHQVVTDREFIGLNVIEFFHVFFGDDAPYSFKEFQKKRGDLDIQYGSWSDELAKGPLSLHPPSTAGDFPFDATTYVSYQTRTLNFKAKTNNSNLLGPAFATTTKVQRLFILSKRCAVLEMKTTLRDIPFADRFFVLERWVVNAKKDEYGLYTILLSISTGAVFTGSCPFESPIRSRSAAAVSDVVNAWCAMATEALKLTEQTKISRLDHIADSHESGETAAEILQKNILYGEGELPVEVSIDSYLGTANTKDDSVRSLKRSVSDPLEHTRRRSLGGIGRSISQIWTRGQRDSLPKSSSEQEF